MTRLSVADLANPIIGELAQLRPKYDAELQQHQALDIKVNELKGITLIHQLIRQMHEPGDRVETHERTTWEGRGGKGRNGNTTSEYMDCSIDSSIEP